MTEWRDVEGFVGRYQVSDDGQVKSLARWRNRGHGRSWVSERILKANLTYGDYPMVQLCGGDPGTKRIHAVHRLVADTFIPKRENDGDLVLHGDGNPLNNSVANLRWGNWRDNQIDAISHGTHPQAAKTHCKWGHPFDEVNTNIQRTKTGRHRYCRTCRSLYDKDLRARRRAGLPIGTAGRKARS